MSKQVIDLSELSSRTGLSLRKLRYCIDKELLPGEYCYSEESAVGQARQLTLEAAVFLACAAVMLESGCKREIVRLFMRHVLREVKAVRNPLRRPLILAGVRGEKDAHVELADGEHLRMVVGQEKTEWASLSKSWSRNPTHEPNVVISINVGRIGKQVYQTGT
jgi:hypothetical protein